MLEPHHYIFDALQHGCPSQAMFVSRSRLPNRAIEASDNALPGPPIDRPQFYISLVSMIIGSQLFIAGFLGELVLRNNKNQDRYKVEEEL